MALEHLAGPPPDLYAGWTNEAAAHHDRYLWAGEMLAEVSNRDARVLRDLAEPPDDDDGPRAPGAGLLVFAAITIERESRR